MYCSCYKRKIRDTYLLQWYVRSLSEKLNCHNVSETFHGLNFVSPLICLLLPLPIILLIFSPGQQTVGDLSSEAYCQGSGARGESHVSHLCLLQ